MSRLSKSAALLIAGLKLLSIALLMLMVFQATIQITSTGKPAVAVVIDVSASMSLIDDYPPETRSLLNELLAGSSGKRRIDLVQQLLSSEGQDLLSGLSENHQLELFAVTSQLEEIKDTGLEENGRERSPGPLNLVAAGKQTDLKTGLTQLLDRYRGSPPSAVVLITDGNSNAGPASNCSEGARQLARRGIPLNIIGIGSTQPVRDLEILEVVTDAVAFVGDRHLFQVHLATTRVPSGKVRVTLASPGSKEIFDSQEVVLKNNVSRYTVELSHAPDRPGPIEYEIAVPPLSGEVNLQNNRSQVRVWSRESRLKVLMVDRVPRWEFRHAKAALERDKTISLSTWLQEADAQYSREDRTALDQLPESLEELAAYDAVIWGDVDPDLVPGSLLSAIPKFVSSTGGGLLLLTGSRFLPSYAQLQGWEPLLLSLKPENLSEPLVVSRTGFRLHRTAEGMVHPVLKLDEPGKNSVWSELPPVYAILSGSPSAESLQILLEGVSTDTAAMRQPLLASHRYGAGFVVLQLFDETWRWKAIDHGKPFRRYWSQVVRFLSKSKALEDHPDAILRTERTSYLTGEAARLVLDLSRVGGAAVSPTAEVETPGGIVQKVAFRPAEGAGDNLTFSAVVENLGEGTYTAKLTDPVLPSGQPSAAWSVTTQDPERTYQPMNLHDLKKSAEMTAGNFMNLWESQALETSLSLRRTEGINRQQMIPLWQRWEFVGLLAGVLISEWALRKRYRLV